MDLDPFTGALWSSEKNRTKGKRKNSSRRNKNAGGGGRSLAPPPFTATFVTRKKLRFIASSAGSVSVGTFDLFDLVCTATAANAAYQMMSGVRIKRVQIWGPMAANLVPVTVSCEWSPNATLLIGQPSRIMSDTSMGAMRAAYVSTKPPTGSLASMWQSYNGGAGSAVLFKLAFPANSVVDVDFEFVLQNGETPTSVTAAVAAATVGAVYVRALDSNGSVLLIPVSYATI